MGLGITPLATIILSGMKPEQAGSATGALTTMQNVGNALGVAVIGVVFFGALHRGFAGAFQASLIVLAVVLVSVAVITRLLPKTEVT
jgi:predicted MFS family arabinose efflux permease